MYSLPSTAGLQFTISIVRIALKCRHRIVICGTVSSSYSQQRRDCMTVSCRHLILQTCHWLHSPLILRGVTCQPTKIGTATAAAPHLPWGDVEHLTQGKSTKTITTATSAEARILVNPLSTDEQCKKRV